MRLHPKVTEEEALSWLLSQAGDDFKVSGEELKKILKPVAEAMAAVSGIELPDELGPLVP